MNNKKLLIFAFLLIAVGTNAQVVQMYDVDEGAKNKGGRTEIPVPKVQYDDNSVEIICDSLVYNVEITITDESGSILHHSNETLSPSSTILLVPDTSTNSKYYIEVESTEQRFYCFFQ